LVALRILCRNALVLQRALEQVSFAYVHADVVGAAHDVRRSLELVQLPECGFYHSGCLFFAAREKFTT